MTQRIVRTALAGAFWTAVAAVPAVAQSPATRDGPASVLPPAPPEQPSGRPITPAPSAVQAPSAGATNPPATSAPPGAEPAPPIAGAPQPVLRTPADQSAAAVTLAALLVSGSDEERRKRLIGVDLYNESDRRVGEMEVLLVDGSGQVRGAVVEYGGFLGLGERRAVVPVDVIRLGTHESERAVLRMTHEQLGAQPAYEPDKLGEYSTRFGWQGLRALR